MAEHMITDIATRSEFGPRDRQMDLFHAVVHADGSWAMALADGLGVIRTRMMQLRG